MKVKLDIPDNIDPAIVQELVAQLSRRFPFTQVTKKADYQRSMVLEAKGVGGNMLKYLLGLRLESIGPAAIACAPGLKAAIR